MITPGKLLSKKARIDILYHLDGLVEAGDLIKRHVRSLKMNLDKDLEKTAQSLTDLEIEVFFHLKYHMKQLRKPFKRLHKRAYDRLAKAERKGAEPGKRHRNT